MKTFEEYLDEMGYSWNDFDRAYEMENLIEQYADERVKQALTIPHVVFSEAELCDNFTPMEGLTSGTICANCGKEKWQHKHN